MIQGAQIKTLETQRRKPLGFVMKRDYGGDSKITCQGLAVLGRVHGIWCSLSGYSKIACQHWVDPDR